MTNPEFESDPAASEQPAAGETPETEHAQPGEPNAKQSASDDEQSAAANDNDGAALADLKAENAKLADELARARADHYNTDQQYANFVRRSREAEKEARNAGIAEVVEALLEVLDGIELARKHDDLVGPFATTAQALENTLRTRFGVERFGEVGEPFDPELHEALFAQESDEVDVDTISEVAQPGYKLGDKVLRAARVLVATAK